MEPSSEHIVEIVSTDGYCVFEPDRLDAKAGSKITFVNSTDKPVSISFSDQDVLQAAFLNLGVGQSQTLTLGSAGAGELTGSVNCDTSAAVVFYTASKPVIIISRRP